MNAPYPSQQGFTVAEVLVTIVILGVGMLGIAGVAATLQSAQRSNQYLILADTAARDILEQARNNDYGSLIYGQTIDKTTSLPATLPAGTASLTTSYVEGMYGFKQLDITVNYKLGTETKTVVVSSLAGESGLTQ